MVSLLASPIEITLHHYMKFIAHTFSWT